MTNEIPVIGVKKTVPERVQRLKQLLKEAEEETKIRLKAQITPDGPVINFIDLDPQDENTTPSE